MRRISTFAVVLLTSLTYATLASGQTGQPGSPIRVQITFDRSVSVNAPPEAMEEARKLLYSLAQKECVNLSAAFNAQCRLTDVNITQPYAYNAGNLAVNSINANANYEVTPKTPDSKTPDKQ